MIDATKNTVESEILYNQSRSRGTSEKGKMKSPERLGRLIPQARNRRNSPARPAFLMGLG